MELAKNCPYCPISNDPGQDILFDREHVLFSQKSTEQGALRHSGIIIPKAHRETVFDLTEKELLATFDLLKEVKAWMDNKFRPEGYNVGWNCGQVGGQSVMHAHMHVLPRFSQEPLAGQGIRSLLKSEQNRW